MLISSTLVGAALFALQSDPVRAPREAFTGCLQRFVTASVQGRKSAEAFATELAQQCQAEEQAYRAAMIRAETAARISQADAEEYAKMEIDDARRNSRESFPDPQ